MAGRPGRLGPALSGLAVSALSDAGSVAVHNSSGHPVTVSLDADGYWLAGAPVAAGAFGPLTGGRVARVTVGGGQTVTVPVAGHATVPGAGAGTVALTAAVSSAFGAGSVTVYPAGARRPGAPSLSWTGGATASGLVVSALGSRGAVALHNSSFLPVTVTLDASGYWLSGEPAAEGTFGPADGARVAQVRVGAGQTVAVPVAGQAGIPASGTGAAVLAVRVPAGQLAGSVTVYPAGASLPDVPSLSWAGGSTGPGLTVSALSDAGAVAVHNSSARPATVTLAAAGYWLAKGRAVSDVVAKPTTVTLAGSDITAVAGDPAASHTVTLAAGVPAPAVGRVLVAPMSATAPDGLLGTVTAVASGPSGTHVVTLSPATLDEAYSTFNVSISHVLTDSDIVPAPGGPAGQTQSTTARPISGPAAGPQARPASGPRGRPASGPAAARDLAVREPAAKAPGLGFSLGAVDFTCTGSGAGPTIALTADMTKTSVDLTLNADPFAPNINFLLTSYPVVDLNVGFTGTLTCKLDDDAALEVHIPIPGTPGLMVTLSPAFTFSASEQASVDFHWTPRAVVGFDKGPGLDSEVHVFHSGGGVKTGASATGNADLFVGLHADIGLAGLTGVGGDVGPDMPVTYDPRTACLTVYTQLRADLTAKASVFVKNWTFAIAKGEFGRAQTYQKCLGPSPSSSASTGPSSPPSASSSSSSAPDGGGWTAAEAPLPGNARSNTGIELSGVSCPAASQCVAVGNYAPADGGDGLLLTGSGDSWTTVQPPLPANAEDGGANAEVRGVSCPSVSQCVAAGEYYDSAGVAQGLLLTGSGGTWTAQEAPLPANAAVRSGMYEGQLTGVSCPSASQCVAVGEYEDTAGSWRGLLLTLADGAWTAQEASLPHDTTDNYAAWLNGVSCPAVSRCVAVGGYGSANGWSLLLTWSGGSWTPEQAPLPADATGGSTVSAVSCASVSQCVAVGHYGPTTNGQAGLLLTDSDGTWTAARAPSAADGANGGVLGVTSVSCPAVSQCVAVGAYDTTASDYEQGLLLTDSGGTWAAAQAPLPANVQLAFGQFSQGAVASVSCPSATACVAVGNYVATSGSGGLLLTQG